MRWIDSPLDISRKFEAVARDWPRSGAQYRWSAADRGYKRVSGRRRFSVCPPAFGDLSSECVPSSSTLASHEPIPSPSYSLPRGDYRTHYLHVLTEPPMDFEGAKRARR